MSTPRPWIKCPYCKEVMALTRAGIVGKRGVPDSHQIKCDSCNKLFYTKGETWREAHGSLP